MTRDLHSISRVRLLREAAALRNPSHAPFNLHDCTIRLAGMTENSKIQASKQTSKREAKQKANIIKKRERNTRPRSVPLHPLLKMKLTLSLLTLHIPSCVSAISTYHPEFSSNILYIKKSC